MAESLIQQKKWISEHSCHATFLKKDKFFDERNNHVISYDKKI